MIEYKKPRDTGDEFTNNYEFRDGVLFLFIRSQITTTPKRKWGITAKSLINFNVRIQNLCTSPACVRAIYNSLTTYPTPFIIRTMSRVAIRSVVSLAALLSVYWILNISYQSTRKSNIIPLQNAHGKNNGKYCSSEVWAAQGFWDKKPGLSYNPNLLQFLDV